MKILIATGIYPPDIGGPATYSALLREKLPERGIDVKILSFGEVRYLPKIIRHFVFLVKALRRSRGCDIIYAQDPVSVGLPSLFASFLMRKKFFIRVAGDYAWEQAVQRYGIKDDIDTFQEKTYGLKTSTLRIIQKFVVRHARIVITPSFYFRGLVSKWNGGKKNVRCIYNGIEFPANLPEKEEVRNNLKIALNEVVLVSAGRLVPWKGFTDLIKLMKSFSENYRLYILGTGPERESLLKYIKDQNIKNVALCGAVSREKVFEYLRASDVFLLNTSFESFSFQVVEAMFAGTPVVTTNIGNLSEIINDGLEGILVTPGDMSSIKKAVEKYQSDVEFREKIIVNARKKAESFSIEKTVDNLIALINTES